MTQIDYRAIGLRLPNGAGVYKSTNARLGG
jgi:hypothetical protein